jgi:hypothetical protein
MPRPGQARPDPAVKEQRNKDTRLAAAKETIASDRAQIEALLRLRLLSLPTGESNVVFDRMVDVSRYCLIQSASQQRWSGLPEQYNPKGGRLKAESETLNQQVRAATSLVDLAPHLALSASLKGGQANSILLRDCIAALAGQLGGLLLSGRNVQSRCDGDLGAAGQRDRLCFLRISEWLLEHHSDAVDRDSVRPRLLSQCLGVRAAYWETHLSHAAHEGILRYVQTLVELTDDALDAVRRD